MLPPILHPPVPPPVVITSGYQLARPDPLDPGRRLLPHLALDFKSPKGGAILAAAAGVVRKVYVSTRGPTDPKTGKPRWYGYGLRVIIEHEHGYRTTYSHLLSASVREGQQVLQGQEIAKADSSGDSTGDHLHFELVNPDGHLIDPAQWMVSPAPICRDPGAP